MTSLPQAAKGNCGIIITPEGDKRKGINELTKYLIVRDEGDRSAVMETGGEGEGLL